MMIKDISGEWTIRQVTYQSLRNGVPRKDSNATYQQSTIFFDKCKKEDCQGWYVFDNTERVPFFYSVDAQKDNLFLNVGSRNGPGLHPSISLNGEAPFLERTASKCVIKFQAGFRNKDGVTLANTYTATAILER